MFINNLFIAAKVYFESKNVSVFNLEDFVRIIRFVVDKHMVSSLDVYEALSSTFKIGFRDVSGYLSLAWHLGVLALKRNSGSSGFVYIATRTAKELASLCTKLCSNQCLEMLRKLFLKWEPLRILLRFLSSRRKFDHRDIVGILGEEMEFWNSKLMTLGLPVKHKRGTAPRKPFNDFVVRKLFKPLLDELQLHGTTLEEKSYIIVKSREGEPIIAAGIAHIASTYRESVLITPFIDKYGVELIARALSLTPGPKYVKLIIRKPRSLEYLNKLKDKAREMGHEIEVLRSEKPLHAKIYGSRNEVLITSANLLRTSLLRNVEVSIDIRDYLYEVESILNDLAYSIQ